MTKSSQDQPQQKMIGRTRWIAMGLVVLGLIGGILTITLILKQPRPVPPSIVGEPTPIAQKPAPEVIAEYKVAADLPKYITIPAIQMERTRVMKLGYTKDYKIAAPSNLFDAGWYDESAKPGKPGAMFIYGHVSSQEANGAFHELNKLKAGDTITVTKGNDGELIYRVVAQETYPANSVPMDKVLSPIIPGQSGLNLMTCAGVIPPGTNEFTERLVVFATSEKN